MLVNIDEYSQPSQTSFYTVLRIIASRSHSKMNVKINKQHY